MSGSTSSPSTRKLKLYILKDQPLKLSTPLSVNPTRYRWGATVSVSKFTPSEYTVFDINYASKLKQLMKAASNASVKRKKWEIVKEEEGQNREVAQLLEKWNFEIAMHLPVMTDVPRMNSFLTLEGELLNKLGSLFGISRSEIKLRITIRDFLKAQVPNHLLPQTMESSELMLLETTATTRIYCHDVTMLDLPNDVMTFLEQNRHIQAGGIFTVEMTLENVDRSDDLEGFCSSINKRILNNEMASDLIIYTGDGTMVNCHKCFLSAQSPVLKAMFETNMEESKNSSVLMDDMAEESVRAFLDYLYHGGTGQPQTHISIAVDLLFAADKYDIPSLRVAMKNILVLKDKSCYVVEDAIRMFDLATRIDIDDGDELKLKAVQVLQRNLVSLKDSEAFQKYLKEDPMGATELFQFVITML